MRRSNSSARSLSRCAIFPSARSAELSAQEKYCRERFDAGGEHVMAFEHFELKGDRAIQYVFVVLNEAGDGEKYHLSRLL